VSRNRLDSARSSARRRRALAPAFLLVAVQVGDVLLNLRDPRGDFAHASARRARGEEEGGAHHDPERHGRLHRPRP
jgi:hypothetical protein